MVNVRLKQQRCLFPAPLGQRGLFLQTLLLIWQVEIGQNKCLTDSQWEKSPGNQSEGLKCDVLIKHTCLHGAQFAQLIKYTCAASPLAADGALVASIT